MEDEDRASSGRRARIARIAWAVVIGLLLTLLVLGCAAALWLTWAPELR